MVFMFYIGAKNILIIFLYIWRIKNLKAKKTLFEVVLLGMFLNFFGYGIK